MRYSRVNLTEYVSRFIAVASLGDATPHVLHLAKRSILDGLGLAVAGSRSDASEIARNHVGRQSTLGAATVLGRITRSTPRFAAFLNGLAIHADDYDDTQLALQRDRVYGLLTHPTAPALPPALALAEQRRASGADFLLAYLVGVEIETKISEALAPRHYEDGFHSTGTVGCFGAAAAAAKLLGFDATTTAVCLGIAGSQAAGLRENFGTMTKPFHAGRAAEAGVIAADLALHGFTAARAILEAPRGFFSAAGGGYARAQIEGKLGSPWTFENPGVSIKPHPSGSLTHPGMYAFAELIRKYDLRPTMVKRITVGTNKHVPTALIHHRPQDRFQGKFSLEFCIAILLVDRRAGLREFTDDTVSRVDVQDVISRIDMVIHPEAEASGYDAMTTIIDVELVDGQKLSTKGAFGKGSPQLPMTDGELVAKFRDCIEWGGLQSSVTDEVAERVMGIEREQSLDEVLARLVPSDA